MAGGVEFVRPNPSTDPAMTLRLTLLFCAALLAASCNLDTPESAAAAPKVTPTQPKSEPVPAEKGDDEEEDDGPPSQAFLWKPVSDSSGKLVVILPASLASVGRITVSGSRTESSSRSAIGNGQRPHYRFSLPGSAYGNNVRITGGGRTWVVPNGSKRTQL